MATSTTIPPINGHGLLRFWRRDVRLLDCAFAVVFCCWRCWRTCSRRFAADACCFVFAMISSYSLCLQRLPSPCLMLSSMPICTSPYSSTPFNLYIFMHYVPASMMLLILNKAVRIEHFPLKIPEFFQPERLKHALWIPIYGIINENIPEYVVKD